VSAGSATRDIASAPAAVGAGVRWGRPWRRAARSTVVVLGAVFALLIVISALFAEALAPYAPDEQNFDLIEARPSAQAVFGTDRFGRDVLSRVIHGSRISLYVALTSIVAAMIVGGDVGLKHVLPNVVSPFVVQGTVALSQAILIEASLSYLGLSAQPPTPSWGNMLNEGRTYLETAPWISVFPGIAIMLTVLAFNLIGDGLRDVLDPSAH